MWMINKIEIVIASVFSLPSFVLLLSWAFDIKYVMQKKNESNI